jgi:hypothetical protein
VLAPTVATSVAITIRIASLAISAAGKPTEFDDYSSMIHESCFLNAVPLTIRVEGSLVPFFP